MRKLKKQTKRKVMAASLSLAVVGSVYAYNAYAVETAVNPTKVVLVKNDIQPHTKITEEMIFEREVPGKAIPPNAFTTKEQIVGKYTTEGFGISANSFFLKNNVKSKNELPDSAILSLENGEVAFPLLVDLETSSGNSIVPGTYVDLYFLNMEGSQGELMTDQDEKSVLFGGLFPQVRITSVKDGETNDAFREEQDSNGETKEIKSAARLYTLAVTPAQLQYLNRAKKLGTIMPVASQNYEGENDTKLRTNFNQISDQMVILKYIEDKSKNKISEHVKQQLNVGKNFNSVKQ
ncbi:RcpC/CpaB family pilus assembly protein [Exiguobacterium antarcticum]|uniref:RcpC/CpaB family pilus assembly protein n=1 Tax=Exiguobacterium antarcticum TaxID=132920 RepID=A0ABT6R4U4_9BACL|nr:RcpC/CpaB family pilus assembly protein [Exiguobacterium antarcticum]MDI3235970.1 RcpC/CpaB family pilus assembly protein [Exiguobacterium antarcticum]